MLAKGLSSRLAMLTPHILASPHIAAKLGSASNTADVMASDLVEAYKLAVKDLEETKS